MTDWEWAVPATVGRVVDGDTVIVTLDLGWRVYRNDERIRVAGIAAPEIRGAERQAGLAAKAHAETLLPVGANVLVRSQAKPTFERTVDFHIPGKGDFGAAMIRAGHAKRV